MLKSSLHDEFLDDMGLPKPLPLRNRGFFRLRLRPWLVGVVLIGFGIYFRFAFKDAFQGGRLEMGRFALLELLLSAAGLLLLWISIGGFPKGYKKAAIIVLWLVAVVIALGAFVGDMPS